MKHLMTLLITMIAINANAFTHEQNAEIGVSVLTHLPQSVVGDIPKMIKKETGYILRIASDAKLENRIKRQDILSEIKLAKNKLAVLKQAQRKGFFRKAAFAAVDQVADNMVIGPLNQIEALVYQQDYMGVANIVQIYNKALSEIKK